MASRTARKKVWVRWLDGHTVHVFEGSILTRHPLQQWIGWLSDAGRHQPGFKERLRKAAGDLEWTIYCIEKMIEAAPTFKTWDGEVCPVLSDYEEEDFIWRLESLREQLNAVLYRMETRRPLQRRIELLKAITPEANASPGEIASAQAAIDRLQRRLDEGR